MTDIDSLQARFVDTLAASGDVSDPEWLTAFREIPRGPFVPYYFTQIPELSSWVLVESSSPTWAEGVYSNHPLITQLNGDDTRTETARRGQPVTGVSTSSSTTPSLMASMLEALDVQPGDDILEIGTGTGYNTALLCHRAGCDHVTSIDIDPSLVSTARDRLTELGYQPHLAVQDGTKGYAAGAPFDRIIATVGIPGVPREWIAQTRVGGIIVLPLDRRDCGGLLARLTVQADGCAQGRLLPDFGGFMPLRHLDRHDAADRAFRAIDDGGDQRPTTLPVDIVTDEADPFEFFTALTLPGGGWNHLTFTPNNGNPTETWIAQGDGSWACHTTGTDGVHTVRRGGPVPLWDRIETAHHHWRHIGRPTRDRFGLTVHHGRHTIWLDRPDSPHQWELPALSSP
ncbi:MAG: ATP-grasp peptide maturase system methyltransferase [Pseudonocardiales bacterium]|nr:ATP-grasp peptide maturase system methyltransferase [Pseudonocardiales bacterium]MBV9032407.1 ATP-grasp peptide maturase system methyltransferase [Pseudonocardiales bacterium]